MTERFLCVHLHMKNLVNGFKTLFIRCIRTTRLQKRSLNNTSWQQGCSARHSPCNGEGSDYKTECVDHSEGNVFSEVHTPCTSKASLVDVGKEYMLIVAVTMNYMYMYFYLPLPNSPYLTIAQNNKPMFVSFLHPVVWKRAHVLFTLVVFTYSYVQHILCCVLFVFPCLV